MSKSQETELKSWLKPWMFVPLLTLVVLVWCYYPSLIKPNNANSLFDGAESLFSALAFAGVIFTVLLQSEELKLQRIELARQRAATEKSAEAQEKSAKAQERYTSVLETQNNLMKLSSMIEIKSQKVQYATAMFSSTTVQNRSGSRNEWKRIVDESLNDLVILGEELEKIK